MRRRTRPLRRVARRGRRADRLRASRPSELVEVVAPRAAPTESTATSCDRALAAAGVDPAGFDSRPEHPARSGRCPPSTASGSCWPTSAETIEANLPGHHRRHRPASSSTTSASPCAAPARCSATAATCFPPTSWRGPSRPPLARRRHRPAAGPRRLRPRVGRLRRRRSAPATVAALEPRAPPAATPTGPPPTPSSPRRLARRRRHGSCCERWTAWLGDADRPGDRRAARPSDPLGAVVRRRIEQGPAPPARARPGDHPGDAGRGRPRLRKDAKKLRYLLECFGGLLPADGAQGVRQAAQGAAGQPRRAPGRRGPRRPAAPRPPTSCRRRRGAGDVRRHRPAHRAARAAPPARPATSSPSGSPPTTARPTRRALDERAGRRRPVKVLATYSIKGGVGKTTAAVNLAYEAARTGARVLLWDLDPQGAATFFVRVKPSLEGRRRAARVRATASLAEHVRATDVAGRRTCCPPTSRCATSTSTSTTRRPTALADAARPARRRLRRRPPRLPAGHHADQRERVRRRRRAARADDPGHAVGAHARPARPRSSTAIDDPPVVLPFLSMVDRRRTVHREVAADLARARGRSCWRPQVPNVAAVERMGVERAPLGVVRAGRAAAPSPSATCGPRSPRRLWR